MRDAILNRMGTEPHHDDWPDLALREYPVQLGKLITGQQDMKETAEAMNRAAERLHR